MNEIILIIEDDTDIREGIRILLESENFIVKEAENGRNGIAALDQDVSLVILDVVMPGISGIKTCEVIRKTYNVPIMFLTAKAQESDKLLGLMAGGDDYLAKPFSYSELLGKVKSLIRRYTVYKGRLADQDEEDCYIEIGGIRINKNLNEVFVEGEEIELSNIEYQMLLLMMENHGKTFSAQNLYESIWKEPYFYSSNSTVMVHIRRLRVKIEANPNHPRYIKTLWGKGYRFEVR